LATSFTSFMVISSKVAIKRFTLEISSRTRIWLKITMIFLGFPLKKNQKRKIKRRIKKVRKRKNLKERRASLRKKLNLKKSKRKMMKKVTRVEKSRCRRSILKLQLFPVLRRLREIIQIILTTTTSK